MNKPVIIAINTIHDTWVIAKGCAKVFFTAVKNRGAGLNPWGMTVFTAHTMWNAHRLKIVAIKTAGTIKPASGEYLDRIAEDFGVRRDGRTDEELRAAVTEARERMLERMQ